MIGEKLTLGVPEAAKRLGIGKNLAYEAIQRGEIPAKIVVTLLLKKKGRLSTRRQVGQQGTNTG